MRLVFKGLQTRLKLTRRLIRWRKSKKPWHIPKARFDEAMRLAAVDPHSLSWNALRKHYAAVVKALSHSLYEEFLKQLYMPSWSDLLSNDRTTTYKMMRKRA